MQEKASHSNTQTSFGFKYGNGLEQSTRYNIYSIVGDGKIAPRFTKLIENLLRELEVYVEKSKNGLEINKRDYKAAHARINQVMAETIHNIFDNAGNSDVVLQKVDASTRHFLRIIYQPLAVLIGKHETDMMVSGAISQARGNILFEEAGGLVLTPAIENIILDLSGVDSVVFLNNKLNLIDYKTCSPDTRIQSDTQQLRLEGWSKDMSIIVDVMSALCSKNEQNPKLVVQVNELSADQMTQLQFIKTQFLEKVVYPFIIKDKENLQISYAISYCKGLDGYSSTDQLPPMMYEQLTAALKNFISQFVQRKQVQIPRLENQTIGALSSLATEELKNREYAKLARTSRSPKNPLSPNSAQRLRSAIS